MNILAHNGGRVSAPKNLLPAERARAIANLRAQGISIDDAATLGEISRAIARLNLEGGTRYKAERIHRVRMFIREKFEVAQVWKAEFKPLQLPKAMLAAIERAQNPNRRTPGDGR